MKKTIYLNFGVLDEQAEVEVTLEYQEAWDSPKESGKPTSEECPAGYVVTDVYWRKQSLTIMPSVIGLWKKYSDDEHFAAAVNQALRDEGIEL